MNLWLFLGAINAFMAVAVGAFGAHVLEGRISTHEFAVFNTGTHYHLIHALAVVAVALAPAAAAGGPFRWACILFTVGTVLFSGSLYIYAVFGSMAVVVATPIGGVCFLAGWAALAWGAFPARG